MNSIVQRHPIACPYGSAQRLLESELTSGEGHRLTWTLHLRSKPETIAMSKDVDVVVSRALDPTHFYQPWNITWTPHDGGPYPTFKGTLTVRADEDWSGAKLELIGSYQPPFGVAGEMFDAVLGSRIAAATARILLDEIGDRLVARYRDEERAKEATT